MKTLYVSDLDGTLLRSNEKTSEYTNQTINELVKEGMIFSYATARSYQTAHQVTAGLNAKIPVIVYNGAFVLDNATQTVLISNFFDKNDAFYLLKDLTTQHIYPIVYAIIDNKEKFSYLKNMSNQAVQTFVNSRKNDPREQPTNILSNLFKGDIFYITCIDSKDKLEPIYRKYKEKFHCVFQEDIYTHDQWLEIMPQNVSKANAIWHLKKYLQCDRLVVFGDGKNDIDMFEIADESYAVNNAVDELKAIATSIIGSNDQDSVAKTLKNHFMLPKKKN